MSTPLLETLDAKPSHQLGLKWLRGRVWLAVFLYWFVAMVGAGLLARGGAGAHTVNGWVILCMLSLVVICMLTERGRWSAWRRLGFVPFAWLLHAVLSLPVAFTVGMLVFAAGRSELVDRAVTFAASLPIVVFAMRQSRLFVALKK